MTPLATITKHEPDTIGPPGHTGRTRRTRYGIPATPQGLGRSHASASKASPQLAVPHPRRRLRRAYSAPAGPALGAIDPGGREPQSQPHQFTPLIDARAASGLLGVPYTWLLAQAREGRIPHHRLGHYVRFSPEDLHDWLEETKLTPTNGHFQVRRRSL